MKLSNYTILFEVSNKYYMYNTLSSALIEINEEIFNYIKLSVSEDFEIDANTIGFDLWATLRDRYFISENPKDDFLQYKSIMMKIRNQKSFMHLTMAPTMECNFNCFYCFETNKPKGKMTPEVMDSIIKYIEAMPSLEKIYLTWFGGEPLLAIEQMELFYAKLTQHYFKSFDSNVITTGYHLSESVIKSLKKIKVSSIQITLDGNKKRHNKIKRTLECDDVFSRILHNVDLVTQLAPEINVVFRVNTTKQNMTEFPELYKLLVMRYKGKNVSISPGIVQDRSSKTHNSSCFLNNKETSEFILDLWHNHKIYTPWLRYPQNTCSECAIRDNQAISFDAEGNAYKCWEMMGQRQYSIGQINKDGMIENVNRILLNRQLYGADALSDSKCVECKFLPICTGGCPIQRIQNEFEDFSNEVCTIYRENIEEFLKIHLGLKESGYENH